MWREIAISLLRGDVAFSSCVSVVETQMLPLNPCVSTRACVAPAACSDTSIVFLAQGSHPYWNAHSLGWGHQPACGPLPGPDTPTSRPWSQAGPSIQTVVPQALLVTLSALPPKPGGKGTYMPPRRHRSQLESTSPGLFSSPPVNTTTSPERKGDSRSSH